MKTLNYGNIFLIVMNLLLRILLAKLIQMYKISIKIHKFIKYSTSHIILYIFHYLMLVTLTVFQWFIHVIKLIVFKIKRG